MSPCCPVILSGTVTPSRPLLCVFTKLICFLGLRLSCLSLFFPSFWTFEITGRPWPKATLTERWTVTGNLGCGSNCPKNILAPQKSSLSWTILSETLKAILLTNPKPMGFFKQVFKGWNHLPSNENLSGIPHPEKTQTALYSQQVIS